MLVDYDTAKLIRHYLSLAQEVLPDDCVIYVRPEVPESIILALIILALTTAPVRESTYRSVSGH